MTEFSRGDYSEDVLAGDWRSAGRPRAQIVEARLGLVVEDGASAWCGSIVEIDRQSVALEDGKGRVRRFPLGPGFLIDGDPTNLIRPSTSSSPSRKVTASGSFAIADAKARIARQSRIFVEGRHDAELIERVWGDDLRAEGVVVEYLEGVDHLKDELDAHPPGPGRRIGVLVDHLVAGSKETAIVNGISSGPHAAHLLIVGHPYVDIWQAIKPARVGLDSWPDIPRDVEWKHGICEALGLPHADQADIARAWKRILGTVRGYTDLEPALLGKVEHLIDFVTAEADDN